MLKKAYIVEKIKLLPDDALEKVADFIDFLEVKKNRLAKGGKKEEGDPLSKVIGICEGPSDLAEQHNKYVYRAK